MLKKYSSIFIVFFILISAHSVDFSNSKSLYAQITSFTTLQNEFLEDDFVNPEEMKLARYFILVSEDTSREGELLNFYLTKSNELQEKLYTLHGNFNVNLLNDSEKYKIGDSINTLLHEIFFIKYNLLSDRISELKDKGLFNCVSSSILYSICMFKYGFLTRAIETKDHVFVSVQIGNSFIDVETTNRFGFEPGTKKDFLNEFGKTTGFTYVPQKNYNDRYEIDLKKLFLLVSHNLATNLTREKNYLKAANIGYFIKTGRNDTKGDEEYFTYFTNYVKNLAREKKFKTGLDLLSYYLVDNNFDIRLNPLQYDIMSDLIKSTEGLQNLLEISQYIYEKHQDFIHKDEFRFNEILFYLNYKLINEYNSINDFDKSYTILQTMNSGKNKNDLLNNIFFKISDNATKSGDFLSGLKMLENAKQYGFDKTMEYDKYRFTLVNNYIVTLSSNKDFTTALDFLKQLDFLSDKRIVFLLKNVYINFGYTLSLANNFEQAILISNEALQIVGDDSTIRTNLKFYYYKIIEQSVGTIKEQYKNEAQKRFPAEKGFF
ncbi:MAG: hypothetical protein A2015_07275 [Spirochaetes bacterium GWF1_31_7]|nr:MAG: hypothetical protein A2Y30_02650 [Spirochaetes bacterium GWE1_32_154]OHD46809.1 MAG: hypothetical protein A2Y29_09735 [Spirochaetes bacterium GWE2_31_10]OHD51218.1 MAG: hypothetical protein A2015_07275 [Spirochaetes bacterium GWF1_31_7]OHD77501.1 MAG: hypothetical protein A2355_08460 [Spirochaetes bacterium RIFOXYB1_FULL_32_8]HBD92536.1 hypothetical protein [Spirochaetia bacterium]